MDNQEHIPVLFHEVLALLLPTRDGRYIDGTIGAGGHSAGILEQSAPSGRVLGFDKDPEAIKFTQERLVEFGDRLTLINASYAKMGQFAPHMGFAEPDGIVLDLGLSSRQLGDAARGFSFMHEGALDMRYDPSQGETAADLINNLTEADLADIFWRYGEEKKSRQIARFIVMERPFTTTTQLADCIAAHIKTPRKRIHPATQVFQALRIAVNHELEDVETGVMAAIELLKPGGHLAVISFHSLEDRFVKQTFRTLSQDCTPPPGYPVTEDDGPATVCLTTRKAIQASAVEIAQNWRSRSARLRVVEKL
ncbi:MAG: 16S rRNA (cytosine(1402)-N(4))-methyltransferase RsmH [Chloroflexi bacterium]|nr:16S rRNA (cytosine(1402)-N(4))-methyltransferase RsmH [Chloroflexota bacterium]